MGHASPRQIGATSLAAAAMAALLWGTFAFGAVYEWAFTPLGYTCAAIGAAGLFVARERPSVTRVGLCLVAVAAVITLQLVPLAPATRATLTPAATRVEAQYQQSYGVLAAPADADAALNADRPLSIAPRQTAMALLLFVAFALFLLGMTRILSVTGAQTIANFLVAAGLALSLVGVGQWLLTLHEPRPLIYGFWQPENMSRPFGPFVNPNHFAGWMLLVLPVTLGLLWSTLERMFDEAAQSTHQLEVAASPGFGAAVLYGFSAIVMAFALVMTRSRSGLAAFALTGLASAWLLMRRQSSPTRRVVIALSAIVVLGGAAAWAGWDALTSKLLERGGADDLVSVGNRLTTWHDAWRIVLDFPYFGTGLNTFGTAMFVYQSTNPMTHFQEAHNDYLQLLAEGGIAVVMPVAVAILALAADIRRRFREAPKTGRTYWLRVGATLGLLAIALQSVVEFSLQMPGNTALFAVVAAMALHVSPRLKGHSSRSRV